MSLQNEQRLLELLADKALGELSPMDHAELQQLLDEYPIHLDSMNHTVSAIELSLIDQPEQLPEELRLKIRAAAPDHLPAQNNSVVPLRIDSSTKNPWPTFARWIGPALVAAVVAFAMTHYPDSASLIQPGAARQGLIGRAKDLIQFPLTATAEPSAKTATGDLVWSTNEQKGFIRVTGLAKNDPTKEQYQLWIFDENQDARYPIDGGVFNIDSSTGTIIIPISAKIKVGKPTMFAVTVEKPGGVVVSSREHISLLAKS